MAKIHKFSAPAKINLALDILGRDPISGYHFLQTVLQEVPELSNRLFFEEIAGATGDIVIETNTFDGIAMESSLISKSLKIIRKNYGHRLRNTARIRVVCEAHIPFSSGLGGAASNAATTLKALNQIWNLKIPPAELCALAEEIGMDVPFFIFGGTAIATNFGEKIALLPNLSSLRFHIIPNQSPSLDKTAKAFKLLDLEKCAKNIAKTQALIRGIQEKNTKTIIENIHNDFETLKPYNHLPEGFHLSGSGPSVFSPVK